MLRFAFRKKRDQEEELLSHEEALEKDQEEDTIAAQIREIAARDALASVTRDGETYVRGQSSEGEIFTEVVFCDQPGAVFEVEAGVETDDGAGETPEKEAEKALDMKAEEGLPQQVPPEFAQQAAEMSPDAQPDTPQPGDWPEDSKVSPPRSRKGPFRRVYRLKAEVIAMRDRFRARRARSAPGWVARAEGEGAAEPAGPARAAGPVGPAGPAPKSEKRAANKYE